MSPPYPFWAENDAILREEAAAAIASGNCPEPYAKLLADFLVTGTCDLSKLKNIVVGSKGPQRLKYDLYWHLLPRTP